MPKTMLEAKIAQLARTCEAINAPTWLFEELSEPKAVFMFKIRPTIRGKKTALTVIRVHHCNPYSTGICPYKGGLRFHPDVSLELFKVLAMDMTEKCILADLPFGGAKGGVAIDAEETPKQDLRDVTEKLTEECLKWNILDPDGDVFGPDVGTNSETMFWIYNKVGEWNKAFRLPNVAASVTGKPIKDNGCPGREDATSFGGLIAIREILKLSQNLDGKITDKPSLVIQGFGNVGSNLARLADGEFRVLAVSDKRGGIFSPMGLDTKQVLKWYSEFKTFQGFKHAEEISNTDLLLLPTDILVPAAIENQITQANAERVRAKLIVELGNKTITNEAYEIFKKRNLPAMPGEAASEGGVIASFLEWARNRGQRWHTIDLPEIKNIVVEELTKIMGTVISNVFRRSIGGNITFEETAHILALELLWDRLKDKHSYS